MAPTDKLEQLVLRLSQNVIEAPDKFTSSQQNEEWTKMYFIWPLLQELGWGEFGDVSYEDSSEESDGFLDYVIESSPRIGVEAKALYVRPPQNREHPQIQKGLKQSKDRGVSYFIWTNGDCWQFFSLAIPEAPAFELSLSNAHGQPDKLQQIAHAFRIIEKCGFVANPNQFDEAILEKWRAYALPAAWDSILKNHEQSLIQLVKKSLPSGIGIDDEDIRTFVNGLIPKATSDESTVKTRRKAGQKIRQFPEAWAKLLSSFEPEYERARTKFRKQYYREFAEFLVSDKYEAWSRATTWRHIGMPRDSNARKKLGNIIPHFKNWNFIAEQTADRYERVEEGIPFLKELLQSKTSD